MGDMEEITAKLIDSIIVMLNIAKLQTQWVGMWY